MKAYRTARVFILTFAFALLIGFCTVGILMLVRDWNSQSDLDGLLPSPNAIVAAWETHGEIIRTVYVPNTLIVTLSGLAIAIVFGLFLAAVMDLVPFVRLILYPILVFTQTIPTFAIAVMLILIFGFGPGPKIVVVILFCYFAIAINTLDGLQGVEPGQVNLLRSMGANSLQIWWKVRLPTAMPAFFSGLRLAATYSVIGTVIGEYVGSGDGLGKYLQRSYRSFNTDQVFLAVIVISTVTTVLVLFVSIVENVMLRWRHPGGITMFRILSVLATVLVIGGSLAQDDVPRLNQRTAVNLLLDWTPNTNHIGFYVAEALGYFDEANIDLSILEPADLSVEQAVDTGIAAFGIGFQEFTTGAIVGGAEVVSVAAIIQHNTSGFATLAENHTLETPADLATLHYAGFSLPDLENAILSLLLECDDSAWDETNYVDVGFADPIELMKHKRVDFAWIFYGWQGLAAEVSGDELDVLMLTAYADCVPDYYTPILITSQMLIDENPELVAAFVHATARGYNYAIENAIEAADILLETVPELDSDLVYASAEWLAGQFQADADQWGEQSLDIWEGFTEFLLDNELISEAIEVENAFTNDFLPGS